MNRVYLMCKIDNISKIGFDYYNKLKPYYILTCSEIERKCSIKSENIFKVIIYDKMCEKLNKNKKYVVILGNIISIYEKLYIIAKELYFLDK